MNKYLKTTLFIILFDKDIDTNEKFIYTNPITMDDMELCYDELISNNCKYSDSFIGLMIAYIDNIKKVKSK